MLHFLDTNILLYSITGNPADADKRARAIGLLDQDDGALSTQVLQEFYVQATRPSRANPLSHELAVRLVRDWTRFVVQDMTLPIVMEALAIKAAHRLSYWDSAIIAAAHALGCATVYSEDMSHGRKIEGVTIINPFR